MPVYEGSRLIELSPDEIFAAVADVSTMPAYEPTVTSATSMPDGRVRVEGQ